MAVGPVLGTETEYGVAARNGEAPEPIEASGRVVLAYPAGTRVQWSTTEETPGRDARGTPYGRSMQVIETVPNVIVSNGARIYVDHAHPEYSTPECLGARQAALHDKAGERIMGQAVAFANQNLPLPLALYKNNSDGKGNSYGAHENYLVDRSLPFAEIVRSLPGFLVSRQIFTGAGKVGSENGRPDVDYQISQRADFFEELVGIETTLRRPIINTRDEPHADERRFRRLHVIIGDATRSEVQTFLKLGTTSLLLAALQDGALPDPLILSDPVQETWKVSHDPSLRHRLTLDDGTSATAVELQWRYHGILGAYHADVGFPDGDQILSLWAGVLEDLEQDPLRTSDRLDWTAKLRLIEGYRRRDGLAWSDAKVRAIDLQYHDIDPDRGLYERLVAAGRMKRLFEESEVLAAVKRPPEGTRAYFRGRCVDRFGDALTAANWDTLVFETGGRSVKRVPMMDPLRGTKRHVDTIVETAASIEDLLAALRGDDGEEDPQTPA